MALYSIALSSSSSAEFKCVIQQMAMTRLHQYNCRVVPCSYHASAVASSCCASGTSRVIASRTADSQLGSPINDRNAATAPPCRAGGKEPSRGVSLSALPAATPAANPMEMIGWWARHISALALRKQWTARMHMVSNKRSTGRDCTEQLSGCRGLSRTGC